MRLIYFFLLLIHYSSCMYADDIIVNKVLVDCVNSYECFSSDNLKSLKGRFEGKEHLDQVVRVISKNDGVSKISYKFKNEKLSFTVNNKPLIENITILVKEEKQDNLILPIRIGDFLSEDLEKRTLRYLKDYFTSQGLVNVKVSLKKTYKEYKVLMTFQVTYFKKLNVRDIKIVSSNTELNKKIRSHFEEFVGEGFKTQSFIDSVEELRVSLNDLGYYFVDVSWSKIVEGVNVDITVNIKNIKRQAFVIQSSMESFKRDIHNELISTAKVYKRLLTVSVIRDLVISVLERNGYYSFELNVDQVDELKNNNLLISRIKLSKLKFLKVKSLIFRGNSYLSEEKILNAFLKKPSDKAENKILDKEYYSNFIKILKKKYIEKGFVYIRISNPTIQKINKLTANVVFKIFEGPRINLSKFSILGVENQIKEYIQKNIFKTKEGEYFNPLQFEKDLGNLKNYMYSKGYYFFKILNESSEDFINYSSDKSYVKINLKLEQGQIRTFNNILFVGNEFTKDKLLLKYFSINKGDILLKEDLKNFQSNLLGLGLFSSVLITPLKLAGRKTDIVVTLKERDFGSLEIAPGIRSDLGPKVSASAVYNNLWGMNRILSVKGQFNQRFDLKTLAPERRDDEKLDEYELEFGYSENKVLNSGWDSATTLSKARRRLYQFDADIQKISQTFSNQFSDWFRFFITYQLETISQFNSTIARESGKFEIGSLTPTFTFDFRDSRINPTSGAYFNLSFERASPFLRSQDNEDLTVDYYKVVLRNFFYIPFKRGTFAVSIAGGMQENLAKNRVNSSGDPQGYIPNVKVFRLSGMDLVRGYDDEEINRLINGNDISEEIIDNKAFMVNIKLEPRFFVNDNFITGVFFDAGRVFVDKFEPNQLRSSYGVTFKYLTPVGTLDFDYGIKTLRKKESNGKLESPGRLHVSIGFF